MLRNLNCGSWASLLLVIFGLLYAPSAQSQEPRSGPEVIPAERQDVSPALRNIPIIPPAKGVRRVIPLRPTHSVEAPAIQQDPVLQQTVGPLVGTTAGLSFAGVGEGDYGFSDCCAPPDTNGAVGATQYVQWVNLSFAVFDKATGNLLYGPAAGNTLWSGFGGACETNNDGDPVVQYDEAANRWVMSQLSVTNGPPFYQCVAVSTTSDATGPFNRYAFQFSAFNDYPKLGVWPDAYYLSFNQFNSSGTTFLGAEACALDRTAMLAGNSATSICFPMSSSVASLLPSDLDGSTAPPAGSPNFFLNFGKNSLSLWKFHVDFGTPSNSTFTGPSTMSVPSFSPACGGGTCIPQPNTGQQLDSLGDRLMYRLAYRNFTDHESLVVNHAVAVGGGRGRGSKTSVGVRWYEIRNPGSGPSVYQSGTFAPDSAFRWMGSIAMDKVGNIALGYSVSSGGIFPSIRFTGRMPSDSLGTMEAETSIIAGAGSQTYFYPLFQLSRWGDYSSVAVDPVDDCTFWYTNEYLKTDGVFNWSTRIASFKFPSCQ
jgi:hypothetical protein